MITQILGYQIQKNNPNGLSELIQRKSALSETVLREALSTEPTYGSEFDDRDSEDDNTPIFKSLSERMVDFFVVVESSTPPESIIVLVRTREDWVRFVEFCADAPLLNPAGVGPISGSFQVSRTSTPRSNPLISTSQISKIASTLGLREFSYVRQPSSSDPLATFLQTVSWFPRQDHYHFKINCDQEDAWERWESDATIEASRVEDLLHNAFPNLKFRTIIEEKGELNIWVHER